MKNGIEKPNILSIHGARADYTKADAVTLALHEQGHSILGFNMSGHNEASGILPEQTSLNQNVQEAKAFFNYLDSTSPKTVIAYSLGGTPALNLLRDHTNEIEKMVLFYPGIYTSQAYDKSFGEAFRQEISRPFSYRENDTINLLQKFKGRLLLIKGEFDGLDPEEYGKPPGSSAGKVLVDSKEYYSPIPKDVIDMVHQAVPQEKRELIEIPNCDHSVILWMRENPKQAEIFINKLNEFLVK